MTFYGYISPGNESPLFHYSENNWHTNESMPHVHPEALLDDNEWQTNIFNKIGVDSSLFNSYTTDDGNIMYKDQGGKYIPIWNDDNAPINWGQQIIADEYGTNKMHKHKHSHTIYDSAGEKTDQKTPLHQHYHWHGSNKDKLNYPEFGIAPYKDNNMVDPSIYIQGVNCGDELSSLIDNIDSIRINTDDDGVEFVSNGNYLTVDPNNLRGPNGLIPFNSQTDCFPSNLPAYGSFELTGKINSMYNDLINNIDQKTSLENLYVYNSSTNTTACFQETELAKNWCSTLDPSMRSQFLFNNDCTDMTDNTLCSSLSDPSLGGLGGAS